MNAVSWVILLIGGIVCGDCARMTVSVWCIHPSERERWVMPIMLACTTAQFAIFGWLFWVTL